MVSLQIRTIDRNMEIPHKGAFCDILYCHLITQNAEHCILHWNFSQRSMVQFSKKMSGFFDKFSYIVFKFDKEGNSFPKYFEHNPNICSNL